MRKLEVADGTERVRTISKLIPLSMAVALACQPRIAQSQGAQPPASVRDALAAELRAAQDATHPMRYQLQKSSPRISTTQQIVETRDGAVAMLMSVNGRPPSPVELSKDQQRLDQLLADPGKQRHRQQQEAADRARALKVLRALPEAFVYQDAGVVATGTGNAERFMFTPNPAFNPPDLETEVLSAMAGEIWIDPQKGRVVRLQAHLERDVEFGWGVLGRLYKGGWITLDQAEVGDGVWRVVQLKMSMSARVLIRTKSFQTTEEESHFEPVPAGLGYREAIAMLRAMPPGAAAQGR